MDFLANQILYYLILWRDTGDVLNKVKNNMKMIATLLLLNNVLEVVATDRSIVLEP